MSINNNNILYKIDKLKRTKGIFNWLLFYYIYLDYGIKKFEHTQL